MAKQTMSATLIVAVFGVLILVAAAFSSTGPFLRQQHAQSTAQAPLDPVVVNDAGNVYHRPACTFLHEKGHHLRTLTAAAAIHEGYNPCLRCYRQALAR